MNNLNEYLFDCHWGLPNDYRSSENSVHKSIEEIILLCRKLANENWIYVYFPDAGNRICIHRAGNDLINVDLQYSDPYCDGNINISELKKILLEHETFQKNPEKYGLHFDES